ncbi:hypothetical protein QUF75_07375 [Desulfococcaceae bacterium HSG7]|nr:hypothetical protein [Desulfococcaceae bacterium HSG7]
MNTAYNHLNEDQLIQLIIDPDDLPHSVRNHLDGCTRCQTEKIQFEEELAAFGRMAKTFAPTSGQKIYPSQQASGRFWSMTPLLTGWRRPILAGGLTIILLICGVFSWQMSMNSSVDTSKMPTIAEIIDEQPIVTDVIPSEDSHLTEIIQQFAHDTNGYLEDEFVEFVAPFEFDQNSV